jgi:hypothetical protein
MPRSRGLDLAPGQQLSDGGEGGRGVGQVASGQGGGEVLDPVEVAQRRQEGYDEPAVGGPGQGLGQHRLGTHGDPDEQLWS